MVRPEETEASHRRKRGEVVMDAQANLSWAVVYMNHPTGLKLLLTAQEQLREAQRHAEELRRLE